MRVLVFFRRGELLARNTILDHAFSLKKYDKKNEYFYFDIWNGRYKKDYSWIQKGMFDVVIFHYSVMALRQLSRHWIPFANLMKDLWRDYPCQKIVIPQDDYTQTKDIWDFVNGIGADIIFSPIREQDFPIIYPKEKISAKVYNVLTGYVENKYIDQLKLKEHKNRSKDVVYRARKLPYDFGKHGQLKYEIVNIFKQELQNSGLVYDIENTRGDQQALLGEAWIQFLASSRTTIGCLGGAGIMDVDGMLRENVAAFMRKYPEADFFEAKRNCFPDMDDNLTGVLSPRVFEAALTKTCQVLVGEDYHGIMIPDEDYIMVKNDFSNLPDVLKKMKDIDYCEKIAQNCYEHLIKTNKYSYEKYAQFICSYYPEKGLEKSEKMSNTIKDCCEKNNIQVHHEMEEFNMMLKKRGLR